MTNGGELLEAAAEQLKSWAYQSETPEPGRLDVWVSPRDLLVAVAALHDDWKGYLAAITGMDAGWGYLSAIEGFAPALETNELEVIYHFCQGAAVVSVRVMIDRDQPVVPSVCGIIPSASFYERELIEMFGVDVKGTPNRDRLFLPDDWPYGVYPLRKDFDIEDAR
jgi:NADH:ubiquinone oxidoreductase subunit C